MKYYAIKIGESPGIYTSWDDCKHLVAGYPGAIYKSFDTREEAEEFMETDVKSHEEMSGRTFTNLSLKDIDVRADLKRKHLHAFVDGSQISKKGQRKNLQPTYGVMILQNNPLFDETHELIALMISGSVKEFPGVHDVTMSNQIAGEFWSAIRATEQAIKLGAKKVTIYYDYLGIELTMTGEWKAANVLSKSYKKIMSELSEQIEIEFVKTKGHNDVLYNEMVDLVAKAGKYLD